MQGTRLLTRNRREQQEVALRRRKWTNVVKAESYLSKMFSMSNETSLKDDSYVEINVNF
jgi:hypothetical protein